MISSQTDEVILAQQRHLVHEVIEQISLAFHELCQEGKDPEKLLAKAVGARLAQLHYFHLVGTKDVFKEFNAPIDIVAWKSSAAQAVAIAFAWGGICDDRLSDLDDFKPKLLFPRVPLIKILADVQSTSNLNQPDNLGDAYIFGVRSISPTNEASPGEAAPKYEPF